MLEAEKRKELIRREADLLWLAEGKPDGRQMLAQRQPMSRIRLKLRRPLSSVRAKMFSTGFRRSDRTETERGQVVLESTLIANKKQPPGTNFPRPDRDSGTEVADG